MISFLIEKVKLGAGYVRRNPNVALVLLLLLVLPLLFLFTNQQFLKAGQSNQDRLQKDRVGLMQDVLVSLVRATEYDPAVIQTEIHAIALQNPDIVEFRVAKRDGKRVIPIAALNEDLVGEPEESLQLYKDASVRLDESVIFEFQTVSGRQWYVYRAFENEEGELYYIFIHLSLHAVDDLFAATTRDAMFSLVLVYLFIAGLAYWHIRMTDYRQLYKEVREANEVRDMFTNMVTHELRAPLTAIRGYASMIEEKTEGQEKEHTKRVRESSERLLTIVNDLLEVARIQSGKLAINKDLVDVSEVAEKVLEELTVSAKNKSIVLEAEGTDVRNPITTDEKRLHQVLTNLVSNAIKYTKEGSITVSVEEKHDVVEMRVKDTGMGISSKDQKKLFAPFFRVEREDVSAITGTGLGMWITKQLVELLGGTIGVESIKGVGTHVVVTLPINNS